MAVFASALALAIRVTVAGGKTTVLHVRPKLAK
jgi:hypothetical protein